MTESELAVVSANNMIDRILSTQANLLAPTAANGTSGQRVGEFISALRDQLIAMYQKTPN